MGKGDLKSRRGKLFRGSFGVRRPRKSNKVFNVVSSTRKASEPVISKEKSATGTTRESSRAVKEPAAGEKTVPAQAEKKKKGEPSGKATGAEQETHGEGKEAVKE